MTEEPARCWLYEAVLTPVVYPNARRGHRRYWFLRAEQHCKAQQDWKLHRNRTTDTTVSITNHDAPSLTARYQRRTVFA